MAIFTGMMILIDYPRCYILQYNFAMKQSDMSEGITLSFGGGLVWPITLPGMLILYDMNKNNFCTW